MKYYIEIFKSKDGWRWHIKSQNGRILVSSEAYATKTSMMRTVKKFAKYYRFDIMEKES